MALKHLLEPGENISRRQFLTATGTAGAVALAGCNNSADPETPEDTDTETQTSTETPVESTETPEPDRPDSYIIDFKDPEGGNIGSYQTPETWDDHVFNQEKFLNETRSKWAEDVAYQTVLKQLENDEDIKSDLYAYPNAEGYDYGHWDLQAFQEAEGMKEIIEWIIPPIGEHVQKNEQGAPSIRNNNYSATAEIGINQLHPQKNNITAGGIDTVVESHADINNHGVSILYDGDEQDYWLMDTVSVKAMKLQEALQQDEIDKFSEDGQYNPLIDGYDEETLDEYDIWEDRMRSSASSMVETFANPGSIEEYDFGETWMDDEYLTSVIEGMQNGEPLEELLQPQMQASSFHYQTGEEVGVSGNWKEAEVHKASQPL